MTMNIIKLESVLYTLLNLHTCIFLEGEIIDASRRNNAAFQWRMLQKRDKISKLMNKFLKITLFSVVFLCS